MKFPGFWRERLAKNTSGGTLARGVHKDYEIRAARKFSQLGSQLANTDHLCGIGQYAFEFLGGLPGNAIVTSQGIAIGDNESSVHNLSRPQERTTSSSTAPCGLSNCTCSAIWPRAWVEQLKHGS